MRARSNTLGQAISLFQFELSYSIYRSINTLISQSLLLICSGHCFVGTINLPGQPVYWLNLLRQNVTETAGCNAQEQSVICTLECSVLPNKHKEGEINRQQKLLFKKFSLSPLRKLAAHTLIGSIMAKSSPIIKQSIR